MKIAVISGARPQFIKLAPILHEFNKYSDIEVHHVHTGQHYDYEMSQLFFEQLRLTPPNLNLRVGSGSHAEQTAKMLIGLEKYFLEKKIDIVLVPGDTNSTLAGALAAAKLKIPVIHLEAGLRSFNHIMPEEINRILTDHLSSLLFAPSDTALYNLANEGIPRWRIVRTGDTMVDSLYLARKIGKKKEQTILKRYDIERKKYYMLTIHRAENLDNSDKFKKFIKAIPQFGKIFFSMHPRTRKKLEQLELLEWLRNNKNVIISEPVGYLESIILMENAKAIITDSGGMQKEAFILGVPCITLRKETEWIESVEMGANKLSGLDANRVIKILEEIEEGKFIVQKKHPYGDGNASKKIVQEIIIRKEKGMLKVQKEEERSNYL